MVRIPAKLLPHTVTVERYLGQGAYGDVYAPAEVVERANVEDRVTMVRDTKGTETVSNATIYLEPPAEPIQPGSLITRWSGTPYEVTSRVITAGLFDHPGGLSHVVIRAE